MLLRRAAGVTLDVKHITVVADYATAPRECARAAHFYRITLAGA
jgi:hypothetical protein